MFSKTPSDSLTSKDSDFPSTEASVQALRRAGQKLSSLIAGDMTLEGNITGGGDLQIDGTIKGDVRVERVTVSESGQVEGGIFAEAVEVRGKAAAQASASQGAGAATKPVETTTIVRKDPPSPFAPKENGGASTTTTKSPTAI